MSEILISYEVPNEDQCIKCPYLTHEVTGFGDMSGYLLLDLCSVFDKIIIGKTKCEECKDACASYPTPIKKQKRLRELP